MATKLARPTASPAAHLKALLSRFDAEHQTIMRGVRTALRKRFPAANELLYDYGTHVVIAYSPSEHSWEAVLSISLRATGVSLYFNGGPKLPDPKKLLRGSGKATRFIELESARLLKHPDVEALFTAALRLAPKRIPATGKGALIVKATAAAKRARTR